MFRRQSDGIELYFNWPSKTARVVPNRSVRHAIVLRDSIAGALVGCSGLSLALGAKDVSLLALVAFFLCVIERWLYLAKFKKVSLQVSRAQVDEAYLKERSVFDGVLATGAGLLFLAAGGYLLITQDSDAALPLILTIPLLLAALIVTYVGIRILAAKLR